MANDVIQADGSVDHWVTSLYTVTETIDGEEVLAVMAGKEIKRSKNGSAKKPRKRRPRRKPVQKKSGKPKNS